MQTIEFEAYISNNCINLPFDEPRFNNMRAKVKLDLSDNLDEGNYNKTALISAVEKAKKNHIFNSIVDSLAWQQELRNEWE